MELKLIKFARFLKMLFCKRFTLFEKDIPIEDLTLQLYFNSNCNARCKFCNIYHNKGEEISPDILYNYLEPIYSKTKVLIPTYGEYTISQKCYEYLNWVCENHPHINLFTETNGIAFNEKWQEFSMKNLVRTACSLNAISPEQYQKTVWEGEGGEKVYEKIITNLRNYQKLLKENNLEVFGTRLSMVIMPENHMDIPEFVRLSLELDSSYVSFMFNNYQRDSKNCIEFQKALRTLLEIERLLSDNYVVFFRLYIPFDNKFIKKEEKLVKEMSIDSLKEKYKDIWKLAKDRDYKKEFEKRRQIREQRGKRPLTFLQELTATGSQYELMGKKTDFCTTAWNHIVIRPDGKLFVCPWECWSKKLYSISIFDFVKNGKIDWTELLNSPYYKALRKLIKLGCYSGCMKNCPFRNTHFKSVYKNLIS